MRKLTHQYYFRIFPVPNNKKLKVKSMRFHFRILFLFAFWAEHVSVAGVLYQAVFRRLCRFCQPFSARRCPAEISVADVLFQVVVRRLLFLSRE